MLPVRESDPPMMSCPITIGPIFPPLVTEPAFVLVPPLKEPRIERLPISPPDWICPQPDPLPPSREPRIFIAPTEPSAWMIPASTLPPMNTGPIVPFAGVPPPRTITLAPKMSVLTVSLPSGPTMLLADEPASGSCVDSPRTPSDCTVSDRMPGEALTVVPSPASICPKSPSTRTTQISTPFAFI